MDRREFLKYHLKGALFLAAGSYGLIRPGASPAQDNQVSTGAVPAAAKRNRIVFISDLHMNVNAGYSWLVRHTAELAAFLKSLSSRDDVAELVILGDMLDDWVCPAGEEPNSFSDILYDPINHDIRENLRALCENKDIKVTYVVGNHDMLSFKKDNKREIQDAFPGLNIISDSPGLGVYTKDNVIWAEHGHRYTMFNAPDIWSNPGGHLPLGYFVSRLAASSSQNNGEVVTTHELYDQYLKEPSLEDGYGIRSIWGDAFISLTFAYIVAATGHKYSDLYLMNGLDGYHRDPLVAEVAETFIHLASNWSQHSLVTPLMAIQAELNDLSGPANFLFKIPAWLTPYYPFVPRIVLFGHTHKAAFQYHSGNYPTIYANTGSWVDKKQSTWVEIAIVDGPPNTGIKVYQVELWYYGEAAPRQVKAIAAPVS